MSDYQGNIIIKNPATPTGPSAYGSAPGMWKLNEVAYWIKQGVWPNPAITPDTYFPYVSLLLSTTSLGNANNNLFVDSSGAFNPVSRNGNTTQGSFTPYSTNWSNYFDGSGDYFTLPYTAANFDWFTSGTDFTIECWFFANSLTGTSYDDTGVAHPTLVGNRSPSATTDYWSFGPIAAGTVRFYYYNGGQNTVTSTATVTANSWNHIAMTKTSSGITIFVNGVAGTTTAISGSPSTNNATGLTIGQGNNTSFNGYVSNLRIVRGTAIYSGNFTVPTAPLTAVTNTTLLTCQSNRFRDASTNNLTLTVTGDTRVTDFGPFSPAYPGASYNQSDITNWSGYLNGSSYWTVPTSTALDVWDNGSGSFTVEAWIFATASIPNNTSVIAKATNDGNPSWTNGWAFQVYNGYLNVNTPGDSRLFNSNTTSVPLNQWVHCALVKSGSTVSIYQNGVRVGTTTNSTAYSNTTDAVAIGVDRNLSGGGKLTGYVSNARMVKGTAVYDPTQSTLTVPTTNLTAVSGTSLLTLQSAAFTDNSGNNYLVNSSGTPTVTGNSPFNTVGYWSNYFDGSGDYLSVPSNAAFDCGTGDWTIEGWVNIATRTTNYPAFFSNNRGGFAVSPPGLAITVSNSDSASYNDKFVFAWGSGGFTSPSAGSAYLLVASSANSLNTWYHLAVVRNGTSIKMYRNGTEVASATISAGSTFDWGYNGALIGGGNWDGANSYMNGYISNLRLVKGTAVYTAAFTPPTSPLTAISGTSLLTCQNGRYIDNSTNAFTVTRNGDVTIQSFDPFYTATIASNGGSMYFDGSGDYLQVPRAANLLPGTNDFTLEAWVYPTTTGTTQFIMGFLEQGVSGDWSMFRYTNDTLGIYTQANGDSFGGVIARNQWNHIALSRVSGTLYKCVNGSATTVSWTGTLNSNLGYNLTVGADNAGDEIFFTGWMYGTRIVNGTGLYSSTTYTVPTTPFTPTANTSFLLNGMNAGIYDATTINDMETVGNAQVSTVQSKFGGSSVYFDGSGDYLAVPPNSQSVLLGTASFTVEFWINPNSSQPSTRTPIVSFGNGFTTNVWAIQLNNTSPSYVNRIQLWAYNLNSGAVVAASTGTISASTWTHVAVVRNGSNFTIYINGVADGTGSSSASMDGGSTTLQFQVGYNSPDYYAGYIDDLRVTRGVARYTANFTPPTQAFPTY